jgi:cell division topological specificity factor
VFEFFKSMFRPEKPSSETAKERLQLVLLSDHIALSPAIIESLKADLLAVISRYVEIDPDQADVTFEHRQREIAMLASIPIKGIRERRLGSAALQPQPAAVVSAPATAQAKLGSELTELAEPVALDSEPESKAGESAAEAVGSASPPEPSTEPAALAQAVPVDPISDPLVARQEDGTARWLALDGIAARPRRRRKAAQVSGVQRKPADAAFLSTQA